MTAPDLLAPYAPPSPAPPTPGAGGVARAVYGLVNDEYAVVGHTPNLARDAARELCLTVGVGDPTVPVDDALSFLDVPGWGVVCTRYATEHDARGRLALVSDSVLVDPATFRSLRCDPFRCFPRRQDRPAAPGELPVPRFSASTPEAEAQRLAEARRAAGDARVRPLLAALLAGEHVLSVSPDGPPPTALLQALVLILPPSLRRLMTFQTVAAAAPRHAPRLTVADRRYAEFGAVPWTRELPRQAGVADPRADRAADLLLALAPAALVEAHALYEELAADDPPVPPAGLLAAAERVTRLGTAAQAVAAGAPADALRALAEGADAAPVRRGAAPDDARIVALLADALAPEALADGLHALLAERSAESYRAGAALVAQLLEWQRPAAGVGPARAEAAAEALQAVLDGVERVRWPQDDPAARVLRAGLAVVAACHGDAARLVQLAELDAPWDAVPTEELLARPGAPLPSAPPSRATRAALAGVVRARWADADLTAAALDGVAALAPALGAARRDAAALALALARRAFAAHRVGVPEPLERVAGALVAFWDRVPGADPRADVLRALLDAGAPHPGGPGTRAAADAAAHLAAAGAAPSELAGWIGAATLRVLAAGADAWPLVAAVDAALAPDPAAGGAAGAGAGGAPGARAARAPASHAAEAIGECLGALLLAVAPVGLPLHGGWPELLERVDPVARRELLVRTLTAVAAGPVPVGELAVAATALAALGFELDAAAADALAPALARWAATLPPTRGGAVRLEAVLALLGALADAEVEAALVERVVAGAPDALRDVVQLRRLAAAAHAVDATRDPDVLARYRATLRARLAAGAAERGALLPGQLARLCDFLGVGSGAPGRLAAGALGILGLRARANGGHAHGVREEGR